MDIQLCKALLAAPLMPTEKLVGLALSYHINAKSKKWKISQARLAEECGISTRTVRRATRALEEAGYIIARHSGRKCIFERGSKSLVNYDRTPMSYQTGHPCPLKSRNPWELDTQFSTKAEEEYKRLLEEENREKSNGKKD
jgi:DNA-binding transcriptional MocR family regulator